MPVGGGEQLVERVFMEAEEGFEVEDLLPGRRRGEWGLVSDGGDHEVLRGVLGGHELEDFGVEAGPFEGEGAQGVGEPFGHAFGENAMAEGGAEGCGVFQLGADLLVAARGDQEQPGAQRDAAEQGVVGGSVTGVQGDQGVQGGKNYLADGSGLEIEALGAECAGSGGVGFDQLGPGFDANDMGGDSESSEQVPGGEREIRLAAAHVGHGDGLAGGIAGVADEMGEHLDIAPDLVVLMGHRRAHLAGGIGNAEGVEPGLSFGAQQVGRLPVVRPGRKLAARRFVGDDAALSFGGRGELPVAIDGAEQGAAERGAQYVPDPRIDFGEGKVAGDIPFRVTLGQRQTEVSLDVDGAAEDPLEIALRLSRAREDEPDEGAVVKAGGQSVSKGKEGIASS